MRWSRRLASRIGFASVIAALPFGSPPPDHVAPPWHWGWVFERPCEPTTDWVAMGFAARQALSFDTGHAITVSAPSDTRPELSAQPVLGAARKRLSTLLLESCATADTESGGAGACLLGTS